MSDDLQASPPVDAADEALRTLDGVLAALESLRRAMQALDAAPIPRLDPE